MDIIVNHSSMQPIYEQIGDQIKEKIMHGILKEDTPLPSVRTLAKELKVSALTVKKAYDALEEEGFVITIHGKGSFVAFADQGRLCYRTDRSQWCRKKYSIQSSIRSDQTRRRCCKDAGKKCRRFYSAG